MWVKFASNHKATTAAVLVLLLAAQIGCTTLGPWPTPTPNRAAKDWGVLLKDQAVSSYVSGVFEKVAVHAKNPAGLSVSVTDASLVNGSSNYTTKQVRVTRGMLNSILSEAELAAYLGHEIAHQDLNHRERRSEKDFWRTMFESLIRDWPPELKKDAQKVIDSYYGRKLEQEADEYGAELAAKAGYNPYALADLFDRLSKRVDKNSILGTLTRTHNELDARAQHVRQHLAQKGYTNHGERGAQRYIRSMISLVGDKSGVPEELGAIRQRVADHANSGQPMSVESFMEIMTRLSELQRQQHAPALGTHSIARQKNFMQDLIYQDKPVWSIEGVITDTLGMLGRIVVGNIPLIGDAIDLFELLSGRDFYTGGQLTDAERLLTALGLMMGSGRDWRATADRLSHVVGTDLKGQRIVAEAAGRSKMYSELPGIQQKSLVFAAKDAIAEGKRVGLKLEVGLATPREMAASKKYLEVYQATGDPGMAGRAFHDALGLSPTGPDRYFFGSVNEVKTRNPWGLVSGEDMLKAVKQAEGYPGKGSVTVHFFEIGSGNKYIVRR